MSMLPSTPSTKVKVPAFVPEFVSKTKSCAPEEVILPLPESSPITTSPVPSILNSIFPLAPSTIRILELAADGPFVSSSRLCAPEVVIFPVAEPLPTTISPVPFGMNEMFPLAASVMLMVDEFVPLFVSKIKSKAPLEVSLPVAPALPITT